VAGRRARYGPVSETIMLRYQRGLFLPVQGSGSLDQMAHEARAEDLFLDLLRRFAQQNRTVSDKSGPNYAPALFAREAEAKRAGLNGKALDAAMRRLFASERIWNEPYGRPSRLNYRIARKGT
jgi:RecA-family ATPase